jgi:hypothetical protein
MCALSPCKFRRSRKRFKVLERLPLANVSGRPVVARKTQVRSLFLWATNTARGTW